MSEDDLLLLSRVCCYCILSSLLCHHNTAKSSSSWPPSLCWYPTTKHTITQVFCSQLTTKEEEEEGAKISQASHPLTCSEEKKRTCPLLCWWSEPAPQTWVILFRSRFSITSSGCWVLSVVLLSVVVSVILVQQQCGHARVVVMLSSVITVQPCLRQSACDNNPIHLVLDKRHSSLDQCTRGCADLPGITIVPIQSTWYDYNNPIQSNPIHLAWW